MSVTIAPIEAAQTEKLDELNASPDVSEMQAASLATTRMFKDNVAPAMSSNIARLMETLGRSDAVVEQLSKASAFTTDGFEYRNQARAAAFNYGPVFPVGMSAGEGANTLQPFVNAFFNRERLNSGERVMPELGAEVARNTGSVFGDMVQASNWDVIARLQSGTAVIDTVGAAQTVGTGHFISAEPDGMQLERGTNPAGPMGTIGSGGPNTGAGFSQRDGAAAGAVASESLSAIKSTPEPLYRYAPPSGAGALSVINAYAFSRLY